MYEYNSAQLAKLKIQEFTRQAEKERLLNKTETKPVAENQRRLPIFRLVQWAYRG